MIQRDKEKKRIIHINYTETKNNKCFFRQGCHNSGKPITVVPELEKYV